MPQMIRDIDTQLNLPPEPSITTYELEFKPGICIGVLWWHPSLAQPLLTSARQQQGNPQHFLCRQAVLVIDKSFSSVVATTRREVRWPLSLRGMRKGARDRKAYNVVGAVISLCQCWWSDGLSKVWAKLLLLSSIPSPCRQMYQAYPRILQGERRATRKYRPEIRIVRLLTFATSLELFATLHKPIILLHCAKFACLSWQS